MPPLPFELIEFILKAFVELEAPRMWWRPAQTFIGELLAISLVCKDWNEAMRVYRNEVILDSPKRARGFAYSFNNLSTRGISFVSLHYDLQPGKVFPDSVLQKLVPTFRHVTSFTIPMAMLASKHIHDVVEVIRKQITKIRVVGEAGLSSKRQDCDRPWWQKAYILHKLPYLEELVLTNINIKGVYHNFQASVISPISRLVLNNVGFVHKRAIEHLCWPLVRSVRSIEFHGNEPINTLRNLPNEWKDVLSILGKDLEAVSVNGRPVQIDSQYQARNSPPAEVTSLDWDY